jgi:hypothetical protein
MLSARQRPPRTLRLKMLQVFLVFLSLAFLMVDAENAEELRSLEISGPADGR